MERTLARIVQVDEVTKHPNADRLAIARIGGWNVVVSLDTKTGERGVYFEIDSVLPGPENPPVPQWVTNLNLKSPVIKSLKIRNVLSQGLFVSMSEFPEFEHFEIGTDVTESLGVVKRSDTADTGSDSGISYATLFSRGPNKTDEVRIQSNVRYLEMMKGKPYYITVKYDGTSGTFGFNAATNSLSVASRNYSAEKDSPHVRVALKYDLENKLREFSDLVLQGEVYGPKIQKNRLNVSEVSLAIFSGFDTRTQKYLDYQDLVDLCSKLSLPMVEVVETGDSFNFDVSSLLEKSRGVYPNTKNHREGIVVRPQHEMVTVHGERVSFKVINNEYLLATGQ